MKKAIAILLALMLLTIAPLSLAETVKLTENASGFDLTIDLPSDATVSVETNSDVPYTFINFTDATMPHLYISVAPTEEYTESSIADLSKDEQDTLFSVFSADLDDPSYTIAKTTAGYDYMLINDESLTDSAMIVLLFNGYFIQMSVWNDNYAVLTDDQINIALSLISTLKIVQFK
ncbi:MAG TPA: hypothetical protein PLP25_10240 [Candidatus Limiplasma sp.]|nr:hypothetical protein [Candidatus Limiplasma sp.]HPS82220.1 hypothetical protein [Candidatus Limiplasma sp.]